MKRLTALILSLMLLMAPLSSLSEVAAGQTLTTENALGHIMSGLMQAFTGANPGLSVTFTSPEGESVSAGFGPTSSGFSAHYDMPDASLLLTESAAYLTDGAGSASVELETLLSTLMQAATGGQSLPSVSAADLQALEAFFGELVMGVLQGNAFSWSVSGSMANLHVDLDGLLAQLNTLLPQLLSKYSAHADALLAQVTPYISNHAVTANELISLWSQLDLASVKTGLVLDGVLFSTGSGMSAILSCMNWNIKADLTETGFALTITAPDGVVYPFDTADCLTVLGILSAVPSSVTAEAFSINSTTEQPASSQRIVTTVIKVDLDLLERDIIAGLAQAITANSMVMDQLAAKYQPWIDLFFTRTVVNSEGEVRTYKPAKITAAWLVDAIQKLNFLPSTTGMATVVEDSSVDSIAVDGYLGNVLFDADIVRGRSCNTYSAAIRVPQRVSPFEMTLTGSTARNGLDPEFTLTFSQPLFGFRTITFSQNTSGFSQYYGASRPYTTAITTDTDVFHFITDSNGVDVKLGDCSFAYRYAQIGESVHIAWPNGYLDLNGADNRWALDSSFGGFSFTQTRNVMRVEGYINEYANYMRPSSFTFMLDNDNEILTLSILPYAGSSVHLTYRTGRLSILADEQELVIADVRIGSETQNITEVTFDGALVATIITEIVAGEDAVIRVFPAGQTDEACWVLSLDFCAQGKDAPANAAMVSPNEFINRLAAILQLDIDLPVVAEPDASQAPAADDRPSMSDLPSLPDLTTEDDMSLSGQ